MLKGYILLFFELRKLSSHLSSITAYLFKVTLTNLPRLSSEKYCPDIFDMEELHMLLSRIHNIPKPTVLPANVTGMKMSLNTNS